MIRGLYAAASGMIFENKRQENIAQNMSNIETPGFRQTFLTAFARNEGELVNNNGQNSLGTLTMKVGISEATLQLTQGPLQRTENRLDFAIDGDGFFTVQGPEGNLFTRDGRFTVDGDGTLVTREGFPVLVADEQGNLEPVVIEGDISVASDGSFFVNGQRHQFAIVNLVDVNLIEQQGNGLFAYNGVGELIDEGFTVNQSMIEGSNVEALDALTDMLIANRALQSNSRVLMAMDETLRLSASEIGRV